MKNTEELPPEPGTVDDPSLGVDEEWDDAPVEENSPAECEINDDEHEEIEEYDDGDEA